MAFSSKVNKKNCGAQISQVYFLTCYLLYQGKNEKYHSEARCGLFFLT